MGGSLVLHRVTAPTDALRNLIAALDAELAQHYPAEQRHGLALDALFQPHIRFFIASLGADAVGCAGIALFPDFAEVKRMFVHPAHRGQSIADALLARLEAEAIAADLRLLRLETGIHQPSALRFYGRAGFRPCAAFEPYTSLPESSISASVFMEKAANRPGLEPGPSEG